jgi:hypothetical protein
MVRRRICGGVRGEERRQGGGDVMACGERRGEEVRRGRCGRRRRRCGGAREEEARRGAGKGGEARRAVWRWGCEERR